MRKKGFWLAAALGSVLLALAVHDQVSITSPISAQTSSIATAMSNTGDPHRESRDPATSTGSLVADGGTSIKAQLTHLKNIQKCFDTATCNYPQTDPRSYSLAVGRDLATHLKSALQTAQNTPEELAELATYARDALAIDDGFVQEAALSILAAQGPSAENLNAIAQHMIDSPEPLVMNQVADYLKSYLGSNLEPQVHQFIVKTLAQGGQFAGEAVAASIFGFINEKSFAYYQRAYQAMDPKTTAAVHLKHALDEYRRLADGG
jgi:hypothetical protein